MDVTEYTRHDALGLAALVRDGEVSPEELLDAALAAARAVDGDVNSIVSDLEEHAREELRRGPGDGPFRGVPFLLKDLRAALAGHVTASGSDFLADNVAEQDSDMVARLRAAGLVIFGFTNSPEFGMSPSTEPRRNGPTRNPWDLGVSAGGSSGGAAAAVAAGIVPAAHGSDGGGSIRIPAACCGVFGFKPSRGVNPAGPVMGEAWNGLSVEHALTRSVRDSAALLDVTKGPGVGDPYASPVLPGSLLETLEREPGPLRVAVQTAPVSGTPVDEECLAAVREAAALLEDLGHHVEEAVPTYDTALAGRSYRIVIGANVQAAIREHAERIGRDPRPGELENVLEVRGAEARQLTAIDLARAVWGMHRTGRSVGAFLTEHDVLLTPTLAAPPLPLGTLDMSTRDVDAYLDAVYRWIPFTSIANICGIPAMSVPFGRTAAGLPLGVQFISGFGRDDLLLRLAAQLERARPWDDERPPVHASRATGGAGPAGAS